jgi:hypothetical protein
MKKKTFDCVEMKHQAQERIRRELAGASQEEELAYWRQIEEEFLARREARSADLRREERLASAKIG